MSFGLGLLLFIVASIAVGICLVAIPGPPGADEGAAHPPSGGHGAH